jgi:hypothetical protein
MLIDLVAAITTGSAFAALYLLCVDIRHLHLLRAPAQSSRSMTGR